MPNPLLSPLLPCFPPPLSLLSLQRTGLIINADAVVQGDTFIVEVGIQVSATIDINATLLVPSFLVSYYTGPGHTGTFMTAPVVQQASVLRKQPVIVSTSRGEGMGGALAGADPLPVQAGELVTYSIKVTLPQGVATNAYVLVDLRSWFMDTVSVSTLTPSSSLLTTSCGAWETVRAGAMLGPDPTHPTQMILPLCTVTNASPKTGGGSQVWRALSPTPRDVISFALQVVCAHSSCQWRVSLCFLLSCFDACARVCIRCE